MANVNPHTFALKATPVDADEIYGQQAPFGSGDEVRATWINAWDNYFKAKADLVYALNTKPYPAIRKAGLSGALASTDIGDLVVLTVGGLAMTLPPAPFTGFGVGDWIDVRNVATTDSTLSVPNVATESINASATNSITIPSGETIRIVFDSATDPQWISDEPDASIPFTTSRIIGALSGDANYRALTFLEALDAMVSTNPLKDFSIKKASPAIAAGVLTLDYSTGPDFNVSLTENITTLTITNWPTTGETGKIRLRLTQDITGGRTVVFTGVKWDGGVAPTVSAAANAIDEFVLWSDDAGANKFGAIIGQAFA